MKNLTKHLDDINETYFQHMTHALRFSGKLAVGSIACLIHAIFPFLCVKAGSAIITDMHHDMVTHRSELTPLNSVGTTVEPGQ
jgi:hypothetical protein